MIATLGVLLMTTSGARAQSAAQSFAVLAGTAVTCTTSTITGDVGVFPGSAVTRTGCPITGTIHAGDSVAGQAHADFINEYNNLRDNPPQCDQTLTGTLAGVILPPGVYCVSAVAKTGTLFLNANGDPNAAWTFLVDGALTGTNFTVQMVGGGQACNVTWWTRAAATLTDSSFVGTILSGAAITVTGGTFHGDALAMMGVTLKDTAVTACQTAAGHHGKHGRKHKHHHEKCDQGVGNGREGCDPGNSNHHNDSNDEDGDKRGGDRGRKGDRD